MKRKVLRQLLKSEHVGRLMRISVLEVVLETEKVVGVAIVVRVEDVVAEGKGIV
jgi:hypothetical protein